MRSRGVLDDLLHGSRRPGHAYDARTGRDWLRSRTKLAFAAVDVSAVGAFFAVSGLVFAVVGGRAVYISPHGTTLAGWSTAHVRSRVGSDTAGDRRPWPAAIAVRQAIGAGAGVIERALGKPTDTSGTPAIGALFTITDRNALVTHFCTAVVVSSPHEDVVATAAHCLSAKSVDGIVFVPGYDAGKTPYGIWQVTAIFVDGNWSKTKDAADDFAFLIIGKSKVGKPLQAITGANQLGTNQPAVELVDVSGYPDASSTPIECENWTSEYSSTQLQFDCDGYTSGTSGSPFLAHVDPKTGLGTVIGLIGGYEEGGITASVSYAAQLLDNAHSLYETASTSSAAAAG